MRHLIPGIQKPPLLGSSDSVPATQYPLLGTHCSVPATRYPLFGTGYSVAAARFTLLATRYPHLGTHCSVPTAPCPLLGTHCSVPATVATARFTLLATRYPRLGTHCSVPAARYPLLCTRFPVTVTPPCTFSSATGRSRLPRAKTRRQKSRHTHSRLLIVVAYLGSAIPPARPSPHRADRCAHDLYDLYDPPNLAAGWEPSNKLQNSRTHISWVGSIVCRSFEQPNRQFKIYQVDDLQQTVINISVRLVQHKI